MMNKMESAKKAEMMQGTSYYQNSVDFYRGFLQGKEFLPIIIGYHINITLLHARGVYYRGLQSSRLAYCRQNGKSAIFALAPHILQTPRHSCTPISRRNGAMNMILWILGRDIMLHSVVTWIVSFASMDCTEDYFEGIQLIFPSFFYHS